MSTLAILSHVFYPARDAEEGNFKQCFVSGMLKDVRNGNCLQKTPSSCWGRGKLFYAGIDLLYTLCLETLSIA